MKSEALKTAWKLFRDYDMTFSQALIEGWKKVKREIVRRLFAETSSEEVTYRQRLVRRLKNELQETFYPVRQKVREQWQKAHELSEQNKANYITKFGYESWMQ